MKTLKNMGITAPIGFKAAGINAGIKNDKLDLGLIMADTVCAVAGVYTTNLVSAGCVKITKKHLENRRAKAIIVNSGNANACTPTSIEDALSTCEKVAKEIACETTDIVVASTGVIGQPLPLGKITDAIPQLVEKLAVGAEADSDMATSIMTTDLTKKQAACQIDIDGQLVTISGIAKGSGMIHPNMATMLGFITTDIAIAPTLLQKAISEITASTFNSITVDGDTSTNDMCIVMASGGAKNEEIMSENDAYDTFKQGLQAVCLALAKEIAKDGEGATKLLICNVVGCDSAVDAKKMSLSVNSSPLVKTAMTGADANWGRVLCAMGYAGVTFDPDAVTITFSSVAGQVMVCSKGMGVDFDEVLAKKILSESEITIDIVAGAKSGVWTTYGCNLTNEYVAINGDYRS